MAVPKLFKMWISSIVNIMIADGKLPFSLLMDLNGLIHKIAGYVFGYGTNLYGGKISPSEMRDIRNKLSSTKGFLELKLTFLLMIPDILTLIVIEKIQPTDVLILCVDGIAPFAKANQQRSRRQASGLERNTPSSFINYVPVEEKFDTAYLTGGLPFMEEISDRIHKWVENNISLLPPTVKISDSRVPGEGEHKMFKILDEIRNNYCTNNIQTTKNKDEEFRKQRHVVYGLDADISLLCTMRDYNFLWLREFKKIERNQYVPECVNINILREHIITSMVDEIHLTNRTKESDLALIRDFITMLFFIGDDFVPGMFTLSFNIKLAVDKFFDAYKEYSQDGIGYISDRNGILIKENLKELIGFLLPHEKELYIFRKNVNDIEIKLGMGLNLLSVEEGENLIKNVEYFRNYNKIPFQSTETYYPASVLEYDYENFIDMWKNILVRPGLMGTTLPSSNKINLIFNNLMTSDTKEKEVNDVCKNYLDMIQWNLEYYMGNYDMNNEYYKYPLAPTLKHLYDFLNNNESQFHSCKRTYMDPIIGSTQMIVLLINPNYSLPVLEDFFGSLSKKNNAYLMCTRMCKYLNVIHPKSFDFSYQGKYYSDLHTKIPLLPPIIFDDILQITRHNKEQYVRYFYISYNGMSDKSIWNNVLNDVDNGKSVRFSDVNKVSTIPNREDNISSILGAKTTFLDNRGEKNNNQKSKTNSDNINKMNSGGRNQSGRGGRGGRGKPNLTIGTFKKIEKNSGYSEINMM